MTRHGPVQPSAWICASVSDGSSCTREPSGISVPPHVVEFRPSDLTAGYTKLELGHWIASARAWSIWPCWISNGRIIPARYGVPSPLRMYGLPVQVLPGVARQPFVNTGTPDQVRL